MNGVSAITTISWLAPDTTTGSGTFGQGSSITIPAGSTVTFALASTNNVYKWGLAINSDNAYLDKWSQEQYANGVITFTLPVAPSIVRLTIHASGQPSGNDMVTGAIVFDNSNTAGVTWGADLVNSNGTTQYVSTISGAPGPYFNRSCLMNVQSMNYELANANTHFFSISPLTQNATVGTPGMGVRMTAQKGDGVSTAPGAAQLTAGDTGGGSADGADVTISAGGNSGGTGNGGKAVVIGGTGAGHFGGDVWLQPGQGAQNGCVDFRNANVTTVANVTGNQAMPANVAGFLLVNVSGTSYRLALIPA
jgi:hypothetical protein